MTKLDLVNKQHQSSLHLGVVQLFEDEGSNSTIVSAEDIDTTHDTQFSLRFNHEND